MKQKVDPSQYGNEHGLSIQHYLMKMIHKILSDTYSKGMAALLATFAGWKDALPNLYHTLGIQAVLD